MEAFTSSSVPTGNSAPESRPPRRPATLQGQRSEKPRRENDASLGIRRFRSEAKDCCGVYERSRMGGYLSGLSPIRSFPTSPAWRVPSFQFSHLAKSDFCLANLLPLREELL